MRRVGCYIICACGASDVWVLTAYAHAEQALCGMLHLLTLCLNITNVQCRAQHPNPTPVAAKPGSIDRESTKTGKVTKTFDEDRERRGHKMGNQNRELRQ